MQEKAKPKLPMRSGSESDETETEVLAALAFRGLTNRGSCADGELDSHQICIAAWISG
jgi:hypothetical protein